MSSTPKVAGINDRPATSRQLQAQATAAAADQAAMATLSVGDLSTKVVEIARELADILGRLEKVEATISKAPSPEEGPSSPTSEEKATHEGERSGTHEQQ